MLRHQVDKESKNCYGCDMKSSFHQIAQKILDEKGGPMSVSEITEEAIRRGLLDTKGKIPTNTMGARLYMDAKSKAPIFYKADAGKFGLLKWNKNQGNNAASASFKSAAKKVLEEEKRPLSFYDITAIALKKGYLETAGKTPDRSMGAQLYTDIKNNAGKSEFVQLGKNRFGLRSWGMEVIEEEVLKKEKDEAKEVLMNRRRSIVGDPINYKGLIFGPLNENGVIFLFSKMHESLGIFIEAIQPSFPDAKARRKTRRGWEDVWIEFEYKSSSFKVHGHDPKECDIIVCWEHDWKNCPLEVIELKSVISASPTR